MKKYYSNIYSNIYYAHCSRSLWPQRDLQAIFYFFELEIVAIVAKPAEHIHVHIITF